MSKDLEFQVGQVVVARAIGGYENHLTLGKQYTVTEYTPEHRSPNFTWPAYVTVMGDLGIPAHAHACRFTAAP